MPVTEDWVSTFESMVFGGVELGREPLDVSLQFPPGWWFVETSVSLC